MTTAYLANILGRDSEAMLALREIPAFHDCSGALLELIFRYGKVAVLDEGEELTREGEFDQWVYFIINGRLAVHVGTEHVDTISSSLVGERCILGEHRRATLRATNEGVTALGVDMALLDALRDEHSTVREPIAVYIELLSIITGEVVNRIAELEFNLIDFSHKYVTHKRSERLSGIMQALASDAYRDDRNANFAVYRHLLRHDPVALSHCCEEDGHTVDTRRFYADAVLAGDHQRIYDAAEAVLTMQEEDAAAAARANGSAAPPSASFSAFAAHMAEIILEHPSVLMWGDAARQEIAVGIRRRLRLGEALKVDLGGLMHWLIAEYRFTAEDTIDLLMTLLKEATDFTARINSRIKTMVHELTQTRFARELEFASNTSNLSVAAYYYNTPVEELIPFFSKNILDVYLVQPFMDRLQSGEDGAWDDPAAMGERDRKGLLATLFE